MTESDLIYFILIDNHIEYNWVDDNVIIFIDHYLIKEFMDLVGDIYLTNGETESILKYGYIGVQMKEICEYFGIDMKKVFRNKHANGRIN
jgi:glucose-6-phosphate 1-dehydrogenase